MSYDWTSLEKRVGAIEKKIATLEKSVDTIGKFCIAWQPIFKKWAEWSVKLLEAISEMQEISKSQERK